jgi:serine/threonine-protein kinase
MHGEHVLGDRYRLTERLGAGGMAVVWKAHDELLNRHVAVKVLNGPQAASPAARRRVQAEAQAAAQLWHPHVTSVFDYGEATIESGDRVPYVVMELLPGRTLAQRLAAGALPPQLALRICAEVASALAAAHARNVVHRDVKPANVMLTPAGAKVVDFGLAAIAGQPDLDEDGQLLGTPAYLAPERLKGNSVLAASDVYALGLLIYRALTDTLPWQADTPTQMIKSHVYVDPAPLPPVNGVPPEVNQVCDRCLAKDPADRPTVDEVAAVLADAAGIVPPPIDDLAALSPDRPEPPAAEPASRDRERAEGPERPESPTGRGPAVDRPDPRSGGGRRRRRIAVAVLTGAGVAVVAAAAFTAPDAKPAGDNRAAGPVDASAGSPAGSPPTGTPSSAAAAAGPTGPGRSTRQLPSLDPADPTAVPTGGAGPAPTPVTAAPPPPAGTPIRGAGGVAWAICNGKKAQITHLDVSAGYTVDQYQPGPADGVKAVLVSATNKTEITVKCAGGAPDGTVKESPRKPPP